MRAVKQALADALRADPAVAALVPATSVYATERAVIPSLPAVELIGLTSERIDTGPMVRHELAIECTVSHATADGADSLLDAIVAVVRGRLAASEDSTRPIPLASGEAALCVLGGTRWSISAADKATVIRGASIAVSCKVSE